MKVFRIVSLLFFSAVLVLFNTGCNNGSSSSKDLDQQIHDYLINNPEILIEMSNKLQEKMQNDQSQKAVAAIKANAKALFNSPGSPVVGNKKGNVTLIEFFDYQCGHCIKMYPVTKQLGVTNPDLRIVFKEFPIFGAVSEYASAAALAAGKQGKYLEMHNALYDTTTTDGELSEASVDAAASKLGLNLVKLKQDMKATDVQQELKATRALAAKLGIQGTPAFIIAPTDVAKASDDKISFIPGSTSIDNLQEAVTYAK